MRDREAERREASWLLDKLIALEEIDEKDIAAKVALGAHEIYKKRMEKMGHRSYAMDGAKTFISRTIEPCWEVFGEMSEAKCWGDLSKGDLLHIEEDKGDCLYEITAMGSDTDNWILKARCYFGHDRGRKITLYKLNRKGL